MDGWLDDECMVEEKEQWRHAWMNERLMDEGLDELMSVGMSDRWISVWNK